MTDTGVEKGDAGFPCAPLYFIYLCLMGVLCLCCICCVLGVIVYFSFFFSVTREKSQAGKKVS